MSRSTSLTDGTCGVCVSLVPTTSPVASPGAGTQQGVPEGSAERMRGGVSADGGNAGTHEAVGRSPPSTDGQTEVQRGKALTFSFSGPEGGCVGSGGGLGLSADFRKGLGPRRHPARPAQRKGERLLQPSQPPRPECLWPARGLATWASTAARLHGPLLRDPLFCQKRPHSSSRDACAPRGAGHGPK